MASDPASLLEQYDNKLDLYNSFRLSAVTAIVELIRLEGLNVHSITSRTKARESFARKIAREEKDSYESLSDITDVVGIRIITHIEDEVDIVGALIRREFVIDGDNSIDKRSTLDADRFGYLSLHYVCSFNDPRTGLAENLRFRGLKLEIQIRTILQHAWAEIEHDLGYKAGSAIPKHIRRRFSRLAGLLEIADDEFRRLRDELENYARDVPKQIEDSPQNVALDDVSLASYIRVSASVEKIDNRMAAHVNRPLEFVKWYQLASCLNEAGISTIQQLSSVLSRYEQVVVAQWKLRVSEKDYDSLERVKRGISIFHVWQVLAVESGGAEELSRIFNSNGSPSTPEKMRPAAEIIKRALAQNPPGSG